MTGTEVLRAAIAKLAAAGIEAASGDARRLLAHALKVAPERVILHLPEPMTPESLTRFEAAIAARLRRQPVSQIIGARLFWGRSFRVTRDVLDPRPETETLIDAALKYPFTSVLDLGTGTGAIALTLLAERPQAQGLATDISPAALQIAALNAADLGLTQHLRLVQSDWFAAVTGRFDLIVSNPPYIAAQEMAGLAPEVREWEPHLALTPGGDGLQPYRVIAAGASAHLTPGGCVMVEIGPTQAGAVCGFFTDSGFNRLEVLCDLDGRDRVVCAMASAR
jgi:release factor glutamine methyltransferase